MLPLSLGGFIVFGACSLPADPHADHWRPRDLALIQIAAALIAHEAPVAICPRIVLRARHGAAIFCPLQIFSVRASPLFLSFCVLSHARKRLLLLIAQ